jgi:hypothetical protein
MISSNGRFTSAGTASEKNFSQLTKRVPFMNAFGIVVTVASCTKLLSMIVIGTDCPGKMNKGGTTKPAALPQAAIDR